ncbi:MAG: hypothetical protein AMS21_10575 [Gemmatimonas sp. SG8_38_2]|jgi:hypothetical protein|nr:MAG: hypothetical protein AMS21_10575 [Gemmatimonas sp. SG8_38_2]
MRWLVCVAVALHLAAHSGRGQELEPRALTNVPVGTNFVALVYAYAQGNILLDPAIPVEDLDSKLHTFVGAYIRALDFFGLSGKLDVTVPFAGGDWEGRLEGVDTTRSVTGFGDPRFRLSLNLVGAPALRAAEFPGYKQKTIVGASLQVIAPLGQYDSSRLLNLGSNRWTFRAQFGVSHVVGPWTFEALAATWFFMENSNFFGDARLEQKPLLAGKLHVIRSFPKGFWLALDGGYGYGGRTIIDGVERETRISTFRFGLTFAAPIARSHTVRLTAVSGARVERGADFDALGLSYQYRWGGGS